MLKYSNFKHNITNPNLLSSIIMPYFKKKKSCRKNGSANFKP